MLPLVVPRFHVANDESRSTVHKMRWFIWIPIHIYSAQSFKKSKIKQKQKFDSSVQAYLHIHISTTTVHRMGLFYASSSTTTVDKTQWLDKYILTVHKIQWMNELPLTPTTCGCFFLALICVQKRWISNDPIWHFVCIQSCIFLCPKAFELMIGCGAGCVRLLSCV